MRTEITIQEAQYVDPRAGNDKFFRTFVFDSSWVTQYGRNGTIGTFTKIIEAGNAQAAQKAADAKFASKVKKGYDPVRSGSIGSQVAIGSSNIALLDELAEALPAGTTTTIVTKAVSAVDLGVDRAADQTPCVRAAFQNGYRATNEDLHPALPMRPMLASTQPDTTVEAAMHDTDWVAQFKYDGDRVVIEIINGEIRVLNRQGAEKVKNVGRAHLRPFTALHAGRWVFDGEVVGRTLVLFDLAAATDGVTAWVNERSPFAVRYWRLRDLCGILGILDVATASDGASVVLAPTAGTTAEKKDFLTTAATEQREGIILRHVKGGYESGRRSTPLIKHKLVKDADVVVKALHETKQSVTLAVHDDNGTLVELGAASTIGKGGVGVGDVWVVTFLYVTDPDHPRLFQPRLVRKRDDKSARACTLDQFANAGTARKV